MGADLDLALRLSRQTKSSWRLRSRTSPPRQCSWRKSLWSRPWCTTSQSSTWSHPETQSKSSATSQSRSREPSFHSSSSFRVSLPGSAPLGKCPTCSPWTPGSICTAWSRSRSTQRRPGSSRAWRWSASWTSSGRPISGRGGGFRRVSCKEWYDPSNQRLVYSCFSVSSAFFLTQAPGYGDIRLSLEVIPDTVNLEEPFDIICKITNCRYNC